MSVDNLAAGGGTACPNCGMVNQADVSFCTKCGAGLHPTGQPQPTMQTPMQVSAQPPGMPPPMPPPANYAQYPYPPGQMVVHHAMGLGNNGLCVASLVLGIVALVFFWVPFFGIVLGLLATVFGAVGLPTAAKKGQMGRGMGIAGLVMGIIALAANIIFILVVWGLFSGTTYYYQNSIQPLMLILL